MDVFIRPIDDFCSKCCAIMRDKKIEPWMMYGEFSITCEKCGYSGSEWKFVFHRCKEDLAKEYEHFFNKSEEEKNQHEPNESR